MTTIDIYRSGSPLVTIDIDEKTVFLKKLQGEHRITSEIIHSSASGLDLTIGDYITYSGENYTINRLPGVVKINNSTFKYNIVFEASRYNLAKKILISSDKLADFSYNGSPADFLDRIIENINEINPTWTAATGTNSTGTDKTLQFINESCLSALGKVSEAYNMEFDINNKVISLQNSIGGASGYSFKYGAASGLYKLERQQVLNQNIITRCYGFGGTTNIPYTYRAPSGGTKRLVFEASGYGYLDSPSSKALYGIIEAQYTNDTIFPQRTGTLTGVNYAASGTGAWNTNTDYLTDSGASGMDFDLNSYLIEGQTAKIIFKSGDISGVECEIWKYDNTNKRFYITPFKDTDGAIRPNMLNYPHTGDSYTLVNISMPASYVTAAETALQVATQAFLDENCIPAVVYSIDIDPKYAANIALNLKVGDKVTIIDTDLDINSLIRISAIEYPLVNPYQIKATIADFVPYSLQERIIKSTLSNTRETTLTDKRNKELARRNTVNQIALEEGLELYAKLASPTFTGIVTTPSIIITDLTDGYVPYRVAATDKLGNSPIYTDGTNVGIGIDPTQKLDVNGSVKVGSHDGESYLFIERFSAVYPYAYILAGSVDNNVGVGIRLAPRDSAGTAFPAVTIEPNGNVKEPNFVTGWFGNNWQIAASGDAEFENLIIRGSARFRELIIDQLSIIAGTQLHSIARGKVASVDIANSKVTLEDPNNKGACAFVANDFFWSKKVDIDNLLFSDNRGQISNVTGLVLTLNFGVAGANGAIGDVAQGDVIVQRGHPTLEERQNLIYTTVSDTGAPFRRTMTGVNSLAAFNTLANIVSQEGNLASLASHDIVPASPGYGYYSTNVYLKGKMVANEGYIGGVTGWAITAGSLIAGADATRIELNTGVGIHMGATAFAAAPFSVTRAGALKANSGLIGGWGIGSAYLAKDTGVAATSAGLSPTDYPFYAGATYANRATAPFRVFPSGTVIATKFIYEYSVGDPILVSSDVAIEITSQAYVKVKTIVLGTNLQLTKTLRVSFTLDGLGIACSGHIYRNGTPAGTEYFPPHPSYTGTFSEDITGWVSSDTIEIWARTHFAEAAVWVSNFRLLGVHSSIVNEVTGSVL